VTDAWIERVRTLLEAPSPAVIATYRKDGSAHLSPVWFRWQDEAVAFEVVIAEGDVKLRHLRANPDCILVVFETILPFRGVEVRGPVELIEGDVTPVRREIAGRYLGSEEGLRYAAQRTKPGVLVRLEARAPRVWDLTPILPS
jgi:PPOX class probable F420-dependent enzyme